MGLQRKKVRLAIIGVGNCASSLVQGLAFYKDARTEQPVPGLMNIDLGGYHVADIEVVAAFDVSADKVGRDLAEAIWAEPNNTIRFADVRPTGVTVERGPTLDGLGRYLREVVREADVPVADVAGVLARTRTDVAVCYLPVGSEHAAEWYAERVLEAGCAFVNCIPVFISSDKQWRRRFEERRLPIIGDDIKSQVGATIVHRALATLLHERGVHLDRTYQINFGGNSDFRNMLERERVTSKKISKTNAIASQLGEPISSDNLHVGPCDYVPWLGDRKFCTIRIEATAFGNVPLLCELKLEVWDSPNSAGVVIDAVRCAKLALDRGIGGALLGPCAYFMKSPPEQLTDAEALLRTEQFIRDVPQQRRVAR